MSDQTTGSARSRSSSPDKADVLEIVAHSTNTGTLADAITGAAKDLIKRVLDGGKADAVPAADMFVGASPLDGLGDGKHSELVSAAPTSVIDNPAAMATPILYVMGLGVLIVIIGGWMLGNYITRPINLLEEGLLAILNGQQDKRFELEHSELGGLAFRIDQLLNQLMGIEEDTTDEQGRPSKAPSAADFREAMSVDRSTQGAIGDGQQVDPAQAQALAAEPAAQYYTRIYREYISAKKALGEQTDQDHHRAEGLRDAHPGHGTRDAGAEVRSPCALPGARAEQGGRPPRRPAPSLEQTSFEWIGVAPRDGEPSLGTPPESGEENALRAMSGTIGLSWGRAEHWKNALPISPPPIWGRPGKASPRGPGPFR